MGNLSGEFRDQNRKDKTTRFPSVTNARQLGLLVNTQGSHLKYTSSNFSACEKQVRKEKCTLSIL